MREIQLTPEDWEIFWNLENFFAIFVKPTTRLQASAYPTLSTAVPQYLRIMLKLQLKQRSAAGHESTVGLACNAALRKLTEYHCLATKQTHSLSNVATVLDPRYNLRTYEVLLPNTTMEIRQQCVREQFEEAWSRYAGRQRDIDAAAFRNGEDPEFDELVRVPDSDHDLFSTQTTTVETGCTRWYKEPRVPSNTDIIQFWASKAYNYPIMAQMARDYLAIPATSAASERVFSNSADIITSKRNRLS